MFRNSNRPVWAFLAIFLAVCFACISTANAQTATRVTVCSPTTQNNELCISWPAVTTDTNGNTITGVNYRVEQRAGTGSYANVSTGSALLIYHAKNLAPGNYTFRVYAACTTCTAESAASNAATGSASAIPVVPSAPLIIIAATIRANGPPTYRIVYTATPRTGEVLFAVPGSMRSIYAAR